MRYSYLLTGAVGKFAPIAVKLNGEIANTKPALTADDQIEIDMIRNQRKIEKKIPKIR